MLIQFQYFTLDGAKLENLDKNKTTKLSAGFQQAQNTNNA